VTAVLSVGESRVTQFLLERNDILDILLLDSLESRLGGLALLVGGLDVEELISTEEGAEMLSPEGRVVVELRGHCEESERDESGLGGGEKGGGGRNRIRRMIIIKSRRGSEPPEEGQTNPVTTKRGSDLYSSRHIAL
jgi:hypothetical protein